MDDQVAAFGDYAQAGGGHPRGARQGSMHGPPVPRANSGDNLGKFGSSVYSVGKRSKAWTKVKCVRQREFVVGGWSEGSGGRSGQIGSLAVGWVDPDVPAPEGHPFALRYAGQVGSG